MKETLADFSSTLETVMPQLLDITEDDSARRPAPNKWSKKEIIGHLIDSAANNHQRFVRVQFADQLPMPGYEQERWVSAQQYQNESWTELVQLWRSYNTHLLHVMAHVPEEAQQRTLTIGGGEPVTLRYVMEDYVRHLKHHLRQVLPDFK